LFLCTVGSATASAILLLTPTALEHLHALKRAGSQVAINAREAVRFLDRVTSGKDNAPTDRVMLQGPMEQYEHWEEAEKFFLPEYEEEPETDGVVADGEAETETPSEKAAEHSKEEEDSPRDDLSQMLLSKLNFKKGSDAASLSGGTHSGAASPPSSRSSRTSPEFTNSHLTTDGTKETKAKQANGHHRSDSGSTVPTAPAALRPLLSALLWRLHSGPDASNAAKACILITNDRTTQVWAQKFGVGVKNIQQLRTSIQYEEREYKNRCKYVEKTQGSDPKTLLSYEDESEEDELVFVPRRRGKGPVRGGGRSGNNRKPAAPKNAAPPEQTVDVPTQPIDPDSFSRSLGATSKQPAAVDLGSQSGAARGLAGASRGPPGGRRGPRGPTRGGRGRGKLFVP
jgi:hypothetical protein